MATTDTRASTDVAIDMSCQPDVFSEVETSRYIGLTVLVFCTPTFELANFMKNKSTMFYVVWGLVLLLVILHQDNWNWEKKDLVFGFMPIGLAWHAGISIAASLVWFMATIFAWPKPFADNESAAKEVMQ